MDTGQTTCIIFLSGDTSVRECFVGASWVLQHNEKRKTFEDCSCWLSLIDE